MATSGLTIEELQAKDQELKAALAQVGEMRPGSLVESYRKCGKPTCHCARRGDRGHGPLWIVTHEREGKTATKAIPAGPAVERTGAQIKEYQRFRALTRELVDTNERICDARLEEFRPATPSGLKKNSTRRGARHRSRRRDRKAPRLAGGRGD